MQYKLSIPCSKTNLEKVRNFVAEVLNDTQLEEVECHKIILAVDEVCANMMIHSNGCNPSKKLDIRVELEPMKKLEFIIRDTGKHFDIKGYNEPSMQEIVSSKRKGGLGLILVKRIMDGIEFSTDKNYNICKLTKKLNFEV
ncbi:MAG: ATP-binding protein [Cyclobacteriaceae bacterium]